MASSLLPQGVSNTWAEPILFLPRKSSGERAVLRDTVYGMDEEQLRKYWLAKVFAGEIPEGVRTLTIDGLSPTDGGYPLSVDE